MWMQRGWTIPFGVSDAFLRLADREPRRAAWRIAVAVGLGVLAFVVVELTDAARMGAFTWTFLVGVVVGLIGAGLWAHRRTTAWSESLRDRWSAWNEAAVGAGSMAETAAKVDGARLGRGRLVAWTAGALLVANGALAIAAWTTLPPTSPASPYALFAYAVAALTGIALGAATAVPAVEATWARSVGRATKALVREGRIGVWGVR